MNESVGDLDPEERVESLKELREPRLLGVPGFRYLLIRAWPNVMNHGVGEAKQSGCDLPARVRLGGCLGHANPSFTLACYGRDPRDTETMVADVLARAAAAGSPA
jgi:hypothetical protein